LYTHPESLGHTLLLETKIIIWAKVLLKISIIIKLNN